MLHMIIVELVVVLLLGSYVLFTPVSWRGRFAANRAMPVMAIVIMVTLVFGHNIAALWNA